MRKLLFFITIVLLISTNTLKAKGADNDEIFHFQEALSNITKNIRQFEEEIKSTPLGDIIKEPTPLIANRTFEDVIMAQQNPNLYSTAEVTAFKGIYSEAIDWGMEKYKNFYGKIYPILKKEALRLKDSPIRLGSVSIDITPFGMGCSLTIDINYNSPIFTSTNIKTKLNK